MSNHIFRTIDNDTENNEPILLDIPENDFSSGNEYDMMLPPQPMQESIVMDCDNILKVTLGVIGVYLLIKIIS